MSNKSIKNPILRGFNPDPSIIRVEDDYYIATSTFEWFPGIRLYHSRNLKDWELIGYPLDTTSRLDLRGVGISQGIWAPCLTYDDGVFYIVYTVVKAFYCNMYDTQNYLYLHVTHDEDVGKCITLLKYENKKAKYLSDYIPVSGCGNIELKIIIEDTLAAFFYREESENDYSCIANGIDASFLSDEACLEGWFTGAMIGICTQDLTGSSLHADFDYFEVKDFEENE